MGSHIRVIPAVEETIARLAKDAAFDFKWAAAQLGVTEQLDFLAGYFSMAIRGLRKSHPYLSNEPYRNRFEKLAMEAIRKQ